MTTLPLSLIAHGVDDGGMAVNNPATGEELCRVRTYSEAEIDASIRRAEAARKDWAGQLAKTRAYALRDWFNLIVAHREELSLICTLEAGKPMAESRGELDYAASFVEWFSEEARRAYGETIPSFGPGKDVIVTKEAVGTCAAITPWNFPLTMITRKAAPALAAGCAMVMKPSESTPLSALALEALARRAGIPEAIFRILPSEDAAMVGRVFCTHLVVRKISFTGSTAVGKLLMRQCADNVTPSTMELGGHAPVLIFADCDLEKTLDMVVPQKFRNAGQVCVSPTRFYVEASIHDAFVKGFADRTAGVTVGNGLDAATRMGPLANARRPGAVEALVEDAIARGARVAAGGSRDNGPGNFFRPTLLADVPAEADIMRVEPFGPVAVTRPFETFDEVVAAANSTPFGLAAFAFTENGRRANLLGDALEAGMIGINNFAISSADAPFGGVKQSGYGSEGGPEGLASYCVTKAVHLA